MVILAASGSAVAEDSSISGFFAAGVAAAPDVEGSSDYQAVPFITSHLHAGQLNVEFEGLTARLHFKPPSWFDAGLSLNYHFGRDDDIDNSVVGRLREIDDTLEAGGFFRIKLGDQWQKHDSLEYQIEAFGDTGSAHYGIIATLSAAYSFFSGKRWRYAFSVETTYTDGDYMDTYFSVDTDNAALSGLSSFDASGGFKDVGLNLNVTLFFSNKLGILGRIAYNHLIGDTADSPIVGEQGDTEQLFGGLSVMYRF